MRASDHEHHDHQQHDDDDVASDHDEYDDDDNGPGYQHHNHNHDHDSGDNNDMADNDDRGFTFDDIPDDLRRSFIDARREWSYALSDTDRRPIVERTRDAAVAILAWADNRPGPDGRDAEPDDLDRLRAEYVDALAYAQLGANNPIAAAQQRLRDALDAARDR